MGHQGGYQYRTWVASACNPLVSPYEVGMLMNFPVYFRDLKKRGVDLHCVKCCHVENHVPYTFIKPMHGLILKMKGSINSANPIHDTRHKKFYTKSEKISQKFCAESVNVPPS